MNAKLNPMMECLRFGHTGKEDWLKMHRPDQRVVRCSVGFHEMDGDPMTRDYRQRLFDVVHPFLVAAELSAGMNHISWNAETGASREVYAPMWRQQSDGLLETMTEEEMFQLIDLLRANRPPIRGFTVTELISWPSGARYREERKFRMTKTDEFTIETRPAFPLPAFPAGEPGVLTAAHLSKCFDHLTGHVFHREECVSWAVSCQQAHQRGDLRFEPAGAGAEISKALAYLTTVAELAEQYQYRIRQEEIAAMRTELHL